MATRALALSRSRRVPSSWMPGTVSHSGRVSSHLPPRRWPASQPLMLSSTTESIPPRRWYSTPARDSTLYDFQGIKTIADTPSTEKILIDVREPSEYQAGFIPSAINIPIASQPDALFLPEEEFEDRFGFQKPPPSKEVVFYCKAGVRSSAAAVMAKQSGYEKVGEYRGSWLDWEKQGGVSR